MRLDELAGSRCVLFLQEQGRDLRIQEFLRELIVGVAAPSDLAGSFLVKILRRGEGGNIEQVARPRNNSPVFVIAHLSLNSLVFISCLLIIFVLIYYMFGLFDILHYYYCSYFTYVILCSH